MKTLAWTVIIIALLVAAPLIALSIGVALPVIGIVLLLLLPGIIIGYIAAWRSKK